MRYKIFRKKFENINGVRRIKMKDGRVFEATGYSATLAGSLGSNDPICTAMILSKGDSREEINPFEILEVF